MKEIGFAVETPRDIIRGMRKHPDLMVWEWCQNCGEEVEIHAYGRSVCPSCGADILPCAMCSKCRVPCVYDSIVVQNDRAKKDFDPWARVNENVHFYVVFVEGGRVLARQCVDFAPQDDPGMNEEGVFWTKYVYPSDAVVDPKEYRKRGSDAFNSFCGPVDLIDLSEREAAKDYSELLRSSTYLPMEKVSGKTAPGRYWMRFDIPPYSNRNRKRIGKW